MYKCSMHFVFFLSAVISIDVVFHTSKPQRHSSNRRKYHLKILNSLAATEWGQQKETSIMTYRALIWSKLSYATPIYCLKLSMDADLLLQVIKNAAMRITKGCNLRASSDRL